MPRLSIAILLICLYWQSGTTQTYPFIELDDAGVMRWSDSGKELHGFGINYTVPFAHAYRMARQKGLDVKQVIDQDIHHFSRLGFDLFRVHVWDTEISDTLGNLLDNEHLDAFDYLLAELKKRNFNIVLTPIAYWGNGWPEPDLPTPGFSAKFGKDACLTEEAAIQAQERYLHAFVSHVNPYTGLAYKDDPDIVAFEVSNEPHHKGTPEQVTSFINRMVAAIRSSGCRQPVFYNMSHSVHLADAYLSADIQGGTFQWYPTGLMYGKALQGNFLTNVDAYPIPFEKGLRQKGKARLVYEFDAANIATAPAYPAMARSFRTAGIQIATHFSYDPGFLAYANTEYNTHYMNLAYTPQKALGLMLAGEVFHRVPLYAQYGSYPDNLAFEGFRLDEAHHLAELLTPDRFIYTATTTTRPQNPETLDQIAGFGNSPLVRYTGLGAYFLDKIAPGKWRLEVMPDVIPIRDPYGKNSPDQTIAVLKWATHTMEINLPGLNSTFSVVPLNEGNAFHTQTHTGSFDIQPGTYLLLESGQSADNLPEKIRNIALKGFYAPPNTIQEVHVLHTAPEDTDVTHDLNIQATVAAADSIEAVYAYHAPGYEWQLLPLEQTGPYSFETLIPANKLYKGAFEYQIVVKTSKGFMTFPDGKKGKPGDWNYAPETAYHLRIHDPQAPVYLFDAHTDYRWALKAWHPGLKKVPLPQPSSSALQISLEKLFREDPENTTAVPIHDYSLQHYVKDRLLMRKNSLSAKKYLVVEGHALRDKPQRVQIALTTTDGRAFGALLHLAPQEGRHRIPISALTPVPLVLLPRPYPTFLPYFFEGHSGGDWTWEAIERVQVSVGPGLSASEQQTPQGFSLTRIWLE